MIRLNMSNEELNEMKMKMNTIYKMSCLYCSNRYNCDGFINEVKDANSNDQFIMEILSSSFPMNRGVDTDQIFKNYFNSHTCGAHIDCDEFHSDNDVVSRVYNRCKDIERELDIRKTKCPYKVDGEFCIGSMCGVFNPQNDNKSGCNHK